MLFFAKRSLFGLLLLYLCALSCFAQTAPGVLILLNGFGSAGKSSIGRVLERTLHNAVFLNEERLVFDAYNDLLTKHKLQPGKPLETIGQMVTYIHGLPDDTEALLKRGFKETGEAFMKEETHRLIQDFMGQGKDVILDNPMWKPEQIQEWEEETKEFTTFHVVVYCPLKNLLEHIQARNTSPDSFEHRGVALPFEMFLDMYQPQEKEGGSFVDRLDRVTVERDLRNAIAYNQASKSPDDPDRSEISIQAFLEKFKLDRQESVKIDPFFAYDLAVNTGTTSTEACAVLITSRLTLRAPHPASKR